MMKVGKPKRMSMMTRAMQRHMEIKPTTNVSVKRRLEAVDRAKEDGIVLDEDVVGLPAEEGKVSFSVEFEEASLNWNMAWDEIESSIISADMALAAGEKREDHRRELAREVVLRTLASNGHVEGAEAAMIAGMVVWLIFTGGNGELLREARISHAGYVITSAPGGANFRLIAGN